VVKSHEGDFAADGIAARIALTKVGVGTEASRTGQWRPSYRRRLAKALY
jgi:hypothetical protein